MLITSTRQQYQAPATPPPQTAVPAVPGVAGGAQGGVGGRGGGLTVLEGVVIAGLAVAGGVWTFLIRRVLSPVSVVTAHLGRTHVVHAVTVVLHGAVTLQTSSTSCSSNSLHAANK